MKSKIQTLTLGLLAICFALPAAAITIGFSPSSQSVSPGSITTVDLVASGLVDSAAPSLGAFDLDVSFNPAVLSFNGVIFGNQLDLFGLGDINAITPGAGILNLFELSLESAIDLDNLQAGTFVLATLSFDIVGTGTSQLGVSVNALGDSLGNSLSAELFGGSITGAGTSEVPEPSTLWLLNLVLIAMLVQIGTRSQSQATADRPKKSRSNNGSYKNKFVTMMKINFSETAGPVGY